MHIDSFVGNTTTAVSLNEAVDAWAQRQLLQGSCARVHRHDACRMQRFVVAAQACQQETI